MSLVRDTNSKISWRKVLDSFCFNCLDLSLMNKWIHLCSLLYNESLDWSSSRVLNWHFEFDLIWSWVAHIFNSIRVKLSIFSTRRDSTRLEIGSTRLDSSRELNIDFSPLFCIIFLHFIESHDGKHEGCLIERFNRKSWREIMKTAQSSYLNLFIYFLSSQVKLLNWVVEFSFSIRLKFLNSTFQFNMTWIQKSFNLI